MKNYYELFRYSLADGESYSNIDLTNLNAKYTLLLGEINTRKSLVHSGSEAYKQLADYEKQVNEAYAILSDETKRANYDASLVNPKEEKKGTKLGTRVLSAVAGLVVAISAFGATAARSTARAESAIVTEAEQQQDWSLFGIRSDVPDLGDVYDDAAVMERAIQLAEQLKNAGIMNQLTSSNWTVEEIFALIKYANGVYVPNSIEEIDILHLNLLEILMSPFTNGNYLYHVIYANGDSSYKKLFEEQAKPEDNVGFGYAFAAYGKNGVYPLVQWFEQKRFEMYSTTDREEIKTIYREVGQVMADLMKGNGCTITYDGVEYRFTSEQLLANHSSALIITTEFQLIMANHYMYIDEKGNVDEVSTTWEVYNKLNSSGTDENGYPIINPDIVPLEEMEAWINNGCDYEWAIESVLINGQTFGQRIQSDMEGMALNNYHMYSVSK